MSHRLQRGTHDMGAGGSAGEAGQGSTRTGIPVGSTQPRQRGHKMHPRSIGNRPCQRLGRCSRFNDAKTIPEPLNGGTGCKNTAFQRIIGGTIELPAHGG